MSNQTQSQSSVLKHGDSGGAPGPKNPIPVPCPPKPPKPPKK